MLPRRGPAIAVASVVVARVAGGEQGHPLAVGQRLPVAHHADVGAEPHGPGKADRVVDVHADEPPAVVLLVPTEMLVAVELEAILEDLGYAPVGIAPDLDSAMALADLGIEAVSFTGSQAGIITDSTHTKAKILEVKGDRVREALQTNYENYEILLVDDGSTDDTAYIAAQFPQVRYIHQSNNGLSHARNTGAAAAKGEVLAYTDSDCMADVDWLYYLLGTLVSGDYAGVGGPNITPPARNWIQACVAAAPGGPPPTALPVCHDQPWTRRDDVPSELVERAAPTGPGAWLKPNFSAVSTSRRSSSGTRAISRTWMSSRSADSRPVMRPAAVSAVIEERPLGADRREAVGLSQRQLAAKVGAEPEGADIAQQGLGFAEAVTLRPESVGANMRPNIEPRCSCAATM